MTLIRERDGKQASGFPARLLPYLLVLPLVLILFPVFFGALLFLLSFSFLKYVPGAELVASEFTFANYARLFDTLYANVFYTTLRIGFLSSVATIALAYPVAYWLNRSKSPWRAVVLYSITLSFFAASIVRVFAWTLVLGRFGFLNVVLRAVGLIQSPLDILYNEKAVVLGLTHFLLPFATLTLMAALQRLDPNVENASLNLGASPIVTFFRITLPLSFPALGAALTLSFALCVSAFTTPLILGGGKVLMLANTLYDIMLTALNFPFASALATVTLVLSLVLTSIVARSLIARMSMDSGLAASER